ncbi:MAG: tRNA 2-thiouridine(34) synthase MnmA [candidate division Zixibacteria bacterium]|nr:tRNA 2-thiouridine(34) synthase MnmA [candidate division Zixibacteria bacterium]
MKTVLLAISGGVDSSVAAALLKDKGYDVVGITFKNFDQNDLGLDASPKSCCSVELLNNARLVCDSLDIPHYVINRVELFEKEVIADFRNSYSQGLTPNPCIRCNSLVRWPELIHLADDLGYYYVATGHYARINDDGGRSMIKRAKNPAKDQSYALWGISPEYLQRTLLPLGEYSKKEVRDIAAKHSFASAETAESQDICFVPEGKYTDMMDDSSPGEIVDSKGLILGKHKGLDHYTIGQRRGLGISSPEPLYVLNIDLDNNRLVVGTDDYLFKSKFEAIKTNWFIDTAAGDKIDCLAKIRYRHEPAPCVVRILKDDRVEVSFAKPQRAITPGQSAVFYDGKTLLGGGVVDSVS